MKLLKLYDDYLRRLANMGNQSTGLGSVGTGPILIVTLPYFCAIVFISALFDAMEWTGIIGYAIRGIVSIILLVLLFYSGFRVVYYRFLRNRQLRNEKLTNTRIVRK